MPVTYNVYCDESAHLPGGHQPVMVLGAAWCPTGESPRIARELREIKKRHRMSPGFEAKWTKVSPSGVALYSDLIRYFFEEPALRFRAVVIRDKTALDHARFGQDHDTWYYKMYYGLLKVVIAPNDRFRIYLDIKDTRSEDKIKKLRQVLCNKVYDFDQSIIENVQTVRSHEIEQIQLVDLLIGAVRYANLDRRESSAKNGLVDLVRRRSRYGLIRSTLLKEEKFNLFFWEPREVANHG